MKGYKGFDKDLKCYGGYQYEIGRTETTDKAELCKTGFHACEHPLDCLNYYEPGESRYCDVDLDDVTDERGDDSKRVGKKITVQGEIGIAGLVKAAVNIGIEEAKSKTTGYCAHAAATGYRAHAATTGERAHAATTGNYAHAAASGKVSIASSLGIEGKQREHSDAGLSALSGKSKMMVGISSVSRRPLWMGRKSRPIPGTRCATASLWRCGNETY